MFVFYIAESEAGYTHHTLSILIIIIIVGTKIEKAAGLALEHISTNAIVKMVLKSKQADMTETKRHREREREINQH